MARTYGILPWDVERLTVEEWNSLVADLDEMAKQSR